MKKVGRESNILEIDCWGLCLKFGSLIAVWPWKNTSFSVFTSSSKKSALGPILWCLWMKQQLQRQHFILTLLVWFLTALLLIQLLANAHGPFLFIWETWMKLLILDCHLDEPWWLEHLFEDSFKHINVKGSVKIIPISSISYVNLFLQRIGTMLWIQNAIVWTWCDSLSLCRFFNPQSHKLMVLEEQRLFSLIVPRKWA